MGRPDLFSARARLERAENHLLALEKEIGAWADAEDDPVIVQCWQDKPELQYTSIYCERLKPIPESWSLLIGDVLGNLGACLDHLAYALVKVGGCASTLKLPRNLLARERKRRTAIIREIYFPYFAGPLDKFESSNAAVRQKLPGVDPRYIRALAPFQPGKRPGKWRWQLAALKSLNNVEKHREPLLTHHALAMDELVSGTPRPVVVERLPRALYPQPKAELVRLKWLFGKPPIRVKNVRAVIDFENPSMDVDFKPACTIIFRERLARREVTTVLWAISIVARQVIEAIEGV